MLFSPVAKDESDEIIDLSGDGIGSDADAFYRCVASGGAAVSRREFNDKPSATKGGKRCRNNHDHPLNAIGCSSGVVRVWLLFPIFHASNLLPNQ
eukprot:scaffold62915_cov22-Prasinocladus_malaysianus.AAC.1